MSKPEHKHQVPMDLMDDFNHEFDKLSDDELQLALQEELGKWKRAGMEPANVNTINIYLDIQLRSMVRFLVAKGIIDGDELNRYNAMNTLDTLRGLRHEIHPTLQKARIAQGIEKPKLIGPNGEILH